MVVMLLVEGHSGGQTLNTLERNNNNTEEMRSMLADNSTAGANMDKISVQVDGTDVVTGNNEQEAGKKNGTLKATQVVVQMSLFRPFVQRCRGINHLGHRINCPAHAMHV